MKPRPLKANPSARGFGKFFERTCVITLTRRPERRARLERHLRRLGLHHGIQWVDAADGHIQKPPRDWRAGAGAWGCRLSHLHVLQQAQADRVEHLLILEDDVVFSPHTADCLPLLLRDLPAVWGQFYLGGQHLADPAETITPRLWRAVNINRTHAYAVHRPALSAIRAHLARLRDYKGRQWHVDHQLGRGQESRLWETYAPSWWLAGQAEGRSDIAGDEPEERWWHHPRYALHLPLFTVPDGVRGAKTYAALRCHGRTPAGCLAGPPRVLPVVPGNSGGRTHRRTPSRMAWRSAKEPRIRMARPRPPLVRHRRCRRLSLQRPLSASSGTSFLLNSKHNTKLQPNHNQCTMTSIK